MAKELSLRTSTQVSEFNPEQVDILRKTLFKGFNDDEIKFSIAVCNRTGLDPFVRQIHFNKRKNRKTGEDTIVITTGIDGFRLTANRSNAYAGSDDPTFKEDDKGPTEATVTVYKIVQGIRCPFKATARWSEYYPGDGHEGFMWRKMPFTMLGKCAEAQALRKAFPAELSNVYTTEEMHQADNTREVVQSKAAEINRLLETPDAPDLEVETTVLEPEFEEQSQTELPIEEKLGDFVILIGQKYKGKKLSELSRPVLLGFLEWVKKTFQNPSVQTQEFIFMAEKYLMEGK